MTLKNYYTLSRNWERQQLMYYSEILSLTEKEARILIHLYKNKGSYVSRIIRLLKIKRSTVFAILQRFENQKVLFSTASQLSGNKIYKLTDEEITKAYMATAFKLCICNQLKEGADENEILT